MEITDEVKRQALQDHEERKSAGGRIPITDIDQIKDPEAAKRAYTERTREKEQERQKQALIREVQAELTARLRDALETWHAITKACTGSEVGGWLVATPSPHYDGALPGSGLHCDRGIAFVPENFSDYDQTVSFQVFMMRLKSEHGYELVRLGVETVKEFAAQYQPIAAGKPEKTHLQKLVEGTPHVIR